MRLYEIFPDLKNIMGDALDSLTKRADQTIKTGKIQKKQASISKTKNDLAKKQKQLADLNSGQ